DAMSALPFFSKQSTQNLTTWHKTMINPILNDCSSSLLKFLSPSRLRSTNLTPSGHHASLSIPPEFEFSGSRIPGSNNSSGFL
ncbi:hypothetical protein ISN44_As06g025730, partial [Arabidopsis suecica]